MLLYIHIPSLLLSLSAPSSLLCPGPGPAHSRLISTRSAGHFFCAFFCCSLRLCVFNIVLKQPTLISLLSFRLTVLASLKGTHLPG